MMEDYEEMMLKISDIMRQANKLRPLMTHEEAVKAIRSIVTPKVKLVDTTFSEVVAYECGQKSVEERPKGKWVTDELHNSVCSICGGIRIDNRENHIYFCNECGADMI